ncbi:hypothetical protein POTOM_004140 [Populus tomentosa]|uniref:Transducin/WD40 repeat-like superfamily protein n=1 Tax=Populus tomentosa TaxID=118781 RepID=A0A8X8AJZ2_POPTO|nr:hypothetical protein POTOM_004140 [Populus tomentosa]
MYMYVGVWFVFKVILIFCNLFAFGVLKEGFDDGLAMVGDGGNGCLAMIKLYDQRMTKRGAVQSYEGHVNSHTRLQLGVDQSERFVMAGGEDCSLRLWSIKSGKLLFEEKISDSVLSTVCWKRSESKPPALYRFVKTLNEGKSYEECLSRQNHSWGTWFGSQEGLFYISWS